MATKSTSDSEETQAGAAVRGAAAGGSAEGVGAGADTAVSGAGSQVSAADAVADTGGPEAQTRGIVNDSHLHALNAKRLHEDFLQESLDRIRKNAAAFDESTNRSRAFLDREIANAQTYDEQVRNVSLQALQNAVAVAQRVSSNSVSHDENIQSVNQSERERTVRIGNLAADRQHNVNEADAMAVLLARVVALEDRFAPRDKE